MNRSNSSKIKTERSNKRRLEEKPRRSLLSLGRK
jgi:hypothetical protein